MRFMKRRTKQAGRQYLCAKLFIPENIQVWRENSYRNYSEVICIIKYDGYLEQTNQIICENTNVIVH